MRVLLTGSKGFIGKNIAVTLRQHNYEVVDYDIIDGHDITNVQQLKYFIEGVDLVFHNAAQANLYSLEELNGARDGVNININGTINIAHLCAELNKKLIYVSTLCVYGDTDDIKDELTCKPEPQELYAYTKLAGEEIVKGYSKNFGMEYCILRFATVYGPGMRDALGCSIFIRQALRGHDVTVHGDGMQERTLTHVNDIADACYKAVMHFEQAKYKTLNISTTEIISALKMAQDIIEQCKSNSRIIFINQRQNQTFKENINNTLAKKCINWEPSFSWNEGLSNTIKFYEEFIINNCLRN